MRSLKLKIGQDVFLSITSNLAWVFIESDKYALLFLVTTLGENLHDKLDLYFKSVCLYSYYDR